MEEAISNPAIEKPSAVVDETKSMIEKADNIARRIEDANKKAEELLQKNEAIAARLMLSGKAEAGQVIKTKEQIDQEKVKSDIDAALKRFRR